MLARKRRHRRRSVEPSQELDLMPMINVFMSIIPLLLLSAAFVQLAVIPTSLPGVVAAQATPTEPKLQVSITIGAQGYVVRAAGLEPQSVARAAGADDAQQAAALKQLQQALTDLAASHPGGRTVRIIADPTTHYDEIIGVMDASRAAGMPEAALADGGS